MAKRIAAVSKKKRATAKVLTPGQKSAMKKAQPIIIGGRKTTLQLEAARKAAATRRMNKLATTPAVAAAITPAVIRSAPIPATGTEPVDLNKLEQALRLAKLLITNGLV